MNKSEFEILADVIRYYYDIESVELPEYLTDAHQRRHRKLVVNTSAGKFLVKTYKTDPAVLDALRFQHRLSDHLDQHDVPVARIKRARDGKGIVELKTWALELQEFVQAEPMQVSTETLAVSAAALGKFHHVCRDIPRPHRDARMWRFSEVPRESFGKLYEEAKKCGDEALATRCCNELALFLRDAAQHLDWQARNRFETGLIHGDWHGGNLLFRGERLVAIIDLEFAGDGCYLEDLAYAISNLCIRTTNRPERLAKRMDTLLDNYQTFRTLSGFEQMALPYAVGVKHIATVSYQIVQLKGAVAGLNALQWMERLTEQSAWLIERARKARGLK